MYKLMYKGRKKWKLVGYFKDLATAEQIANSLYYDKSTWIHHVSHSVR